MKKTILIVIVIITASFVAFSYLRQKTNPLNKKIFISGNIEATEVRVSFRVSGEIKELLTDEGKFAKAGDVIAKLDTDELTKIKDQAENALAEAKFNYERLKEDYDRAENLYQAGATPAQKRDIAKTNCDVAKAKLDNLKASLDLASLRLSYADLKSPIDGYVLTKSAEAGEVVQTGSTIFTIADLKNIWLTGYINETDLGSVKLNEEADIKTDTYPDKIYKGRISFISDEAEFTPKQIQTKEERTKLVYRIKIAVDNTSMELKPGMPADAYINPAQWSPTG